ncbi:hypothetical protein JOQ06_004946 [Pogonophryne albipinna]|uniref:SET domain-containing protein n=1 Tax=Pogonophryne albipinna TaxID=1090488 RepID=A0AAD6FD45_9TELE|nr:hypothetical protein JOQ06_016276 [Pogonophryne albipinna]KAJ4929337.1 hypothetical protein JOQ06_004946 [Pogonophryne albipinna]
MQRRRRITPKDDARFYIDTGGDKAGLDVQYINAIKDISPGEEITYNYGDSDWPWRCKVGEVMPLETCATQATSPNENIEEMVKNSDCTESYMKTTGPVLSPLSRAERGLDEVMPLETCGATSPNENIESAIWLKAKYLMNEQYKI